VTQTFPNEKINVLDAFAGWGGNIIQFGLVCNQVYGWEIDTVKEQYWDNNCKIYGVENYKICLKDYLLATAKDFDDQKI